MSAIPEPPQQQQQIGNISIQQGGGGGGQQAAAPIWIDSTTKSLLKKVSDDATLLTAVLFNTPTVGCHHVQKHVQSRAPKVIEEGRMLGRRMHESYEGLQKDVTFGADFAIGLLAARKNIQNIALLSRQVAERHQTIQRELAATAIATGAADPSAPRPPHPATEEGQQEGSTTAAAAAAVDVKDDTRTTNVEDVVETTSPNHVSTTNTDANVVVTSSDDPVVSAPETHEHSVSQPEEQEVTAVVPHDDAPEETVETGMAEGEEGVGGSQDSHPAEASDDGATAAAFSLHQEVVPPEEAATVAEDEE